MSLLEEYADKSEMGFLPYTRITTGGHFDNWYETSKKDYDRSNFIFRGATEANHKLYTSSQRLMIHRDLVRFEITKLKEHYFTFLMTLLQGAKEWNSKLVPRFYMNSGMTLNDFALFSLMQHYGVPTPLLDFTTDLDVAIYFAFRGTDLTPSNDLTKNFVSIYIIDLDANKLDLSDPIGQDLASVYPLKKLILFAEVENDHDEKVNPYRSRYTNTNFNIINQKGVFLFNYHPYMPINVGTPRKIDPTPDLPYITCIDIHKSIKERALNKMAANGIYDDFLFADFNKFKTDVTSRALSAFSK